MSSGLALPGWGEVCSLDPKLIPEKYLEMGMKVFVHPRHTRLALSGEDGRLGLWVLWPGSEKGWG